MSDERMSDLTALAPTAPNNTLAVRRAARIIASMWRMFTTKGMTTRLLLESFMRPESFVSKDTLDRISFDDLVEYLRRETVVSNCRKVLERFHRKSLLSARRASSNPGARAQQTTFNVRVFLAAFMVVCRPTHVFESIETLEQNLIDSSTIVIRQFDSIVALLAASPRAAWHDVPASTRASFHAGMFIFFQRFQAWKVPDAQKLNNRIENALLALYRAAMDLPPNEPENSNLRTEFRKQIQRLEQKLVQYEGQQRLEQLQARWEQMRLNGDFAELDLAERPLTFPRLNHLSKDQLAHELLIDPTFRLVVDTDEGEPLSRLSREFGSSFWDEVLVDLQTSSRDHSRVLRVLEELRGGFIEVDPGHNDIDDIIHVTSIRQEMERGAFGWDAFQRLINAVVCTIITLHKNERSVEFGERWAKVHPRLHAENLPETERPAVMVQALRFLMTQLVTLRTDSANAR